jgi:hypothetical protein
VRERRGVIEAELAMGEPVWDFPLNPDERCLATHPDLHVSFSTTWGTADAAVPFGLGEAELRLTIDGEEQTFTTVSATAGRVPDLLGRPKPTVNVFGLREDGTMILVVLTFEEMAFAVGAPEFHGVSTLGVVLELVDGVPVPLGFLSDGAITLDAAGMEDGARVSGEVTSPWYSR